MNFIFDHQILPNNIESQLKECGNNSVDWSIYKNPTLSDAHRTSGGGISKTFEIAYIYRVIYGELKYLYQRDNTISSNPLPEIKPGMFIKTSKNQYGVVLDRAITPCDTERVVCYENDGWDYLRTLIDTTNGVEDEEDSGYDNKIVAVYDTTSFCCAENQQNKIWETN